MFSWLINNVSALKPADLPVDPLTWPSSSSCSTTDEIHCDSLTLNVCLNTSCYYRKITPFIAHTHRQTYYYSKVGFVWAPTWCDHMINVFVHICSILDTIALSTEYLWNSGVFKKKQNNHFDVFSNILLQYFRLRFRQIFLNTQYLQYRRREYVHLLLLSFYCSTGSDLHEKPRHMEEVLEQPDAAESRGEYSGCLSC